MLLNFSYTLRLLSFLFVAAVLCLPAFASDWVEDEELSDFYMNGVKHSGRRGPPPAGALPYVNQQPGSRAASPAGQYGIPPVANPPQMQAGTPGSSSGGSLIGKLGKSLIGIPKSLVDGTGDAVDNPRFWQGAGALAGIGANAYMANKYNRNNPGPYWNNPLNPISPYANPIGPYYNQYNRGLINPINPMFPYNQYNGLINPYNRYTPYNGLVNPYNRYNGLLPYNQNSPYIVPTNPNVYDWRNPANRYMDLRRGNLIQRPSRMGGVKLGQ